VLEFFRTASRNLLAAEAAAGVAHHVALSVVGNDRLPDSGYLRAKAAQERVVTAGTVPYTIVGPRSSSSSSAASRTPRPTATSSASPPALMRPIAADDVAAALADVATRAPVNGVEIARPEPLRLDELARRVLQPTATTGQSSPILTPLLRDRARRQLARTLRRRADRPHALGGLAAPVGSAEPVAVTSAQWTRPTSPTTGRCSATPPGSAPPQRRCAGATPSRSWTSGFPASTSWPASPALWMPSPRMDELADLGHEVVSAATEITEHVLNYVLPHRGQR
jgi:hypothetical protein